MVCTKKQLMKRLKDVGDNEKLLFLFWEKGEFDGDIEDRDLTAREWNKILSDVYTEEADQLISDQITEAVAEIVAKEEEKLANANQ